MSDLRAIGWKHVAVTTAIGLLASAAYAALAPAWFEASLTLVPRDDQASQPAGALGGALTLLAGNSGDIERIACVLQSRSASDAAIEKLGLIRRYDQKYIELARKSLWKHCNVDTDKIATTVTLTCEDKDPAVAQALAAFFGEYGNQLFARVTAGAAREERQFLERRVAEARRDVDYASRRLQHFEEEHKLIDLDEQARAVVDSIASVRGAQTAKELELRYLLSFSSADEPAVVQLRKQLAILGEKVRALEEAQPGRDGLPAGRIFPGALGVPALEFALGQIYRQQQIAEAVFSMLTQQLEVAMINEARDTSTFQVLDEAVLPTLHARPHRALVVMVGFMLSLILGIVWDAFTRSRRPLASPQPQPSESAPLCQAA